MNLTETNLTGCFVLQPRIFSDERGKLIKTYHEETFKELGLTTQFREEYYSVSQEGVLRGLHFQLPPHDHVKCVTCVMGKIFDVVVDLRTDSPTFRSHFSIVLDSEKANMLYIPQGFAHGFLVLSESAIFLNRTSIEYKAESDNGIRWDTCGIEWPVAKPILSTKDKQWSSLEDFKSPFSIK